MKTSRCSKIYDAVVRRISALGLPTNARVLDAPCGDGEVAILLAKESLEVSGVDIVDELSGEARAVLGERFRVADLTAKLPWPDASFDLVVSIEGIEHLENAFAFVREMHRLCRPGGIFILSTPNTISIRSRVRFLGSGFYLSDPRPLDESSPHPLHHLGLRTFSDFRLSHSRCRTHACETGQLCLCLPRTMDLDLHSHRVPQGAKPQSARPQ
jgi:SAM-dependent methyltransferase